MNQRIEQLIIMHLVVTIKCNIPQEVNWVWQASDEDNQINRSLNIESATFEDLIKINQ